MSYELRIAPPPYVTPLSVSPSTLVQAHRRGLPSGHFDIVTVGFHFGLSRWYFEREIHSPVTTHPRDMRIVDEFEALRLFEEATNIALAPIDFYTEDGVKRYHNGEVSVPEQPTPVRIVVGREYRLPRATSTLGLPANLYVGIDTTQGPSLVVAEHTDTAQQGAQLRHLSPDQIDAVVRTNLRVDCGIFERQYDQDLRHRQRPAA